MTHHPKIYVAGHRSMVGSAIVRSLQQHSQTSIATRNEVGYWVNAAYRADFGPPDRLKSALQMPWSTEVDPIHSICRADFSPSGRLKSAVQVPQSTEVDPIQSIAKKVPVVRIAPRYFRPTEVETLLGDPSKAKQKLGWVCLRSPRKKCAPKWLPTTWLKPKSMSYSNTTGTASTSVLNEISL